MADRPAIDTLAAHHLDRVLAINNASARETSPLDRAGLAHLVEQSVYARVTGIEPSAVDAFVIAMDQDADYESPNFRWFKARLEAFLYIDRVVVAQTARGKRLARTLYEDLFAFGRGAGHRFVACEVNRDPPNPRSDAFHAALGFSEAGAAVLAEMGKTVRYLVKPLSPMGE
ncbi:MAG: GNAT family N-acetyltransferase [Alphaproteobacteria bacterium]